MNRCRIARDESEQVPVAIGGYWLRLTDRPRMDDQVRLRNGLWSFKSRILSFFLAKIIISIFYPIRY